MTPLTFKRLNHDLYSRSCAPATKEQVRILEKAGMKAEESNSVKYRVGALLFNRNGMITEAVNQAKTHPRQKYWGEKTSENIDNYRLFLHAEIAAIIQAKSRSLTGSTIYVARVDKNGDARCSYPCRICFPALQHAGVSKIVCYNVSNEPVSISL